MHWLKSSDLSNLISLGMFFFSTVTIAQPIISTSHVNKVCLRQKGELFSCYLKSKKIQSLELTGGKKTKTKSKKIFITTNIFDQQKMKTLSVQRYSV